MESVWCTERTRILPIVLFLGLYFVSETTAKSCSFNPSPCSCSDETLTCSSFEEVADLRKEVGDLNITSIEFSFGNITNVSRNSLPPGLNKIKFTFQPLTTFSDDAFINSAQTLNSLTIFRGNLRQLPKALLVLTNLTSLHIWDNPIQTWDDSILAHIIANITYLKLQNVSLTAWPGSISLSHALTNLTLSNNPLKSIPDHAFVSLNESLLELDLSHTGLTHIPMALSSLSSLTSLDLSGIALSNVSDIEQLASMSFVSHKFDLILESSQLKAILNFSSFTNLDGIFLGNNSISDASTGSFPSSLTYLYLDNNLLTSMPSSIATLADLYLLYLSSNRFTSIEPGSLPTSLEILNLMGNKITVITNTTFINMTNLTTLQLSYNPISIIESSAFTDLVSLKILYLSGTSIKEIPLAIASLRPNSKFTFFSDELSCPCPPHQELVDWFKLTNGTVSFTDLCYPFTRVSVYLTTGCDATTTIPITSTTVSLTDTTPGGATTLQSCLFSAHGSVLLLVSVFLFFFLF